MKIFGSLAKSEVQAKLLSDPFHVLTWFKESSSNIHRHWYWNEYYHGSSRSCLQSQHICIPWTISLDTHLFDPRRIGILEWTCHLETWLVRTVSQGGCCYWWVRVLFPRKSLYNESECMIYLTNFYTYLYNHILWWSSIIRNQNKRFLPRGISIMVLGR